MPHVPTPVDPEKLLPFSLYAILVAVVGALIVEASKETRFWSAEIWLIAGIVLVAVIFLLYDRRLRSLLSRARLQSLHLVPQHGIPSAKALILLIGRGDGASSARWAIDFHAPTLQHVWLISSTDEGSKQHTAQLSAHIAKLYPLVRISTEILPNLHSIAIAKTILESVLRNALRSFHHDEVVADLTGMTKSASAGMLLAFLSQGGRLTVMEPTHFLPDGKPDSAHPSHPVEITRAELGT